MRLEIRMTQEEFEYDFYAEDFDGTYRLTTGGVRGFKDQNIPIEVLGKNFKIRLFLMLKEFSEDPLNERLDNRQNS